jgi:hypothetical protein
MKRHSDCDDDIELRKEMLAAGYVPLRVEGPPASLTLEVVAGKCGLLTLSQAKQSTSSRCAYITTLMDELELRNILLRTPWCDGASVVWIGPRMADSNVFQLPSGRQYGSEQVLNASLRGGFTIGPGKAGEGYLLGVGCLNKIPDEWIFDPRVPAEVSIVDQLDREHFSEIEMLIDRNSLLKRAVQPHRKGKGLFEPLTEVTAPSIQPPSEEEPTKVVLVQRPSGGMPEAKDT